jgi:hypothetical protein
MLSIKSGSITAWNRSHLRRPFGSLIIPVVVIFNPRYTSMQTLDDKTILAVEFSELGLYVDLHQWVDQFWCLRGN